MTMAQRKNTWLSKRHPKAMLAKVETTKGVIDGRQELIMALEWVLDEGVSTSMSLESVFEELEPGYSVPNSEVGITPRGWDSV